MTTLKEKLRAAAAELNRLDDQIEPIHAALLEEDPEADPAATAAGELSGLVNMIRRLLDDPSDPDSIAALAGFRGEIVDWT